MKTHLRVIAILTALLLVAIFVAALRAQRNVVAMVTLTGLPNLPSPAPNGHSFRIMNSDDRAILLIDLIVETNCPAGWLAFSHTVPTHPQRLATGETKDLVVAPPPSGAPWRLRVAYGTDIKGPALWLNKAAFVIFERRWAGHGFGIMAGSNSCLSAEMIR